MTNFFTYTIFLNAYKMNSSQYEHKYVSRAYNVEEKLFQLLFNLTARFFLNASNEFYFKDTQTTSPLNNQTLVLVQNLFFEYHVLLTDFFPWFLWFFFLIQETVVFPNVHITSAQNCTKLVTAHPLETTQ